MCVLLLLCYYVLVFSFLVLFLVLSSLFVNFDRPANMYKLRLPLRDFTVSHVNFG